MSFLKRLTLFNCALVSFFSISAERVGDQAIPFPFVPSDTTIIVDDVEHTDIYVGDRFEGADLWFDIPIHRYVGDVKKLLAHNLIDEYATIQFAVYDVDHPPSKESRFVKTCNGKSVEVLFEINKVYLVKEDGKRIDLGMLKSGNNQWSMNDGFQIKVSDLDFPMDDGGDIGLNRIEIHVDTGNEGDPCGSWKTEIDFVALSFKVIDPFILLPGFGGSEQSLINSNYQSHLMNRYGIPSKIISYPPPDIPSDPFSINYFNCSDFPISFELNEKVILPQIEAQASIWKTDSINIAAHSKGGLESLNLAKAMNNKEKLQVYAANVNNTLESIALKVNTVISHASPFLGARAADKLQTSAKFIGKRIADYSVLESAVNYVPQLCDLTTINASKHSTKNKLDEKIAQYKIGSDANASGNSKLSANDLIGNQIQNVALGNLAWKITGGSDDETTPFKANDTMVTIESAINSKESKNRKQHIVYKNHGTVIDEDVQEGVIIQFIGRNLPWSYDHE